MKRNISVILILLLMVGLIQSQTDTPTPPLRSIFDYDTCAPPCWMGLIPGESNVVDAGLMFEQNQDLIDPERVTFTIAHFPNGERAIDSKTGTVISATYNFHLGEPHFDTMGVTSRIEIDNRVVHAILIHPDTRISLADALEDLGEPDIVRMTTFSFGTWMKLIYLEPRLRVGLQQEGDECTVASLDKNMVVSLGFYYSPIAAVELWTPSFDVEQPRLLGYTSTEERVVPLDLWHSWLAGEVQMTCAEAWAQLPEPVITPVPESTSEATEEAQ